MKQLTLVYDEALESQIAAVLQGSMAIARYTKVEGVVGARMDALAESDFAVDTRNNMMIIITDDDTMMKIVSRLQALRKQLGHGFRGVVTKAEVVI